MIKRNIPNLLINNTSSSDSLGTIEWQQAKYRKAYVTSTTRPLMFIQSSIIKKYLDLKMFTFMTWISLSSLFFQTSHGVNNC